MMIPDPHTVSAYAFYNGLAWRSSTKRRKRRSSAKKQVNASPAKSKTSEPPLVDVVKPSTSNKVNNSKESFLLDKRSSLPDKASSSPDKPSSLLDKATSLPDKASSLSDKPSSLPDKASSLPVRKAKAGKRLKKSEPKNSRNSSRTDEELNFVRVKKQVRKKTTLGKQPKINEPENSFNTSSTNEEINLDCIEEQISTSHVEDSNISSSQVDDNDSPESSLILKRKKTVSARVKGNLVRLSSVEKFNSDVDRTAQVKKRRLLQKVTSQKAQNSKKQKFNVEPVSESEGTQSIGINATSIVDKSIKLPSKSLKSRSQIRREVQKKQLERKESLKRSVHEALKNKIGSQEIGKKVLETLLAPTSLETFFKVYWEKKPLLINRNQSSYFKKYLSIKDIDTILRFNALSFTKNIDVTTYSNGERETHNPVGRAQPHVVWDYYSNGCSIRILNPQTYLPKVHTLLSSLQEYFGCFVGSNVYLTPPNSQGFAPHYDDIEAFVLQIEGSKRWRVYAPRSEDETLPRYSSPNFSNDEIGEPILDVTLMPGDMLYFPRGFIHQAETVSGVHSLHITLSVYQKTAWIDLMEKALPKALDEAWKHHVEFRKGLPIGYLNRAGFGYPGYSTRQELHQRMKKLLPYLEKYFNVDAAVDAMGVRFMHEALPPVLSDAETRCSVHNGGIIMQEDAQIGNRVRLQKDTKIRLLRANCCRLVEEIIEGEGLVAKLYTTVENSKVFEEEEPNFLIIPREMVPAVHHLLSSYPSFISLKSLPLPNEEEKLLLASDLWEHGVLLTEEPLPPIDDSASDDDSNNLDLIL